MGGNRLGRAWRPPPRWPKPPPGWSPPPGWQPDPAWPAPPAGHLWWPYSAATRWLLSVSLCWALLSVAAVVTFLVVGGNQGPCWFDPPPGDYGSFRIVNDSASTVTLVDCLDASCTDGENPEPVAADASTGWTYEMCSGPSVGVRNRSGVLLGCLVLPVGEPPAVSVEEVSHAGPCAAG